MRSVKIISDFFLQKDFTNTKKKHKKHKMQASDFDSDIFVRLKRLKSKQATFIQIFLYA